MKVGLDKLIRFWDCRWGLAVGGFDDCTLKWKLTSNSFLTLPLLLLPLPPHPRGQSRLRRHLRRPRRPRLPLQLRLRGNRSERNGCYDQQQQISRNFSSTDQNSFTLHRLNQCSVRTSEEGIAQTSLWWYYCAYFASYITMILLCFRAWLEI